MEKLRITASLFSWDSTECDISRLRSLSFLNGQTSWEGGFFFFLFLLNLQKTTSKALSCIYYWTQTMTILPPTPQNPAHSQNSNFSKWTTLSPRQKCQEIGGERANNWWTGWHEKYTEAFVHSTPLWPGRQPASLFLSVSTKMATVYLPSLVFFTAFFGY